MSTQAKFITFEGGEGAGKSTQIAYLAERLQQHGHSVCVTREPGGTAEAEEIRAILTTGEPAKWDPLAETLLHLAARRQHLARKILPSLDRGEWVLCDRFYDSTRAYQGSGQGVAPDLIERLHEPVLDGVHPALTILLDIDPLAGLARAQARGENARYEQWPAERHAAIRSAFLDIANREPERCYVLDASQSADEIWERIWERVQTRFAEYFP